MNIMVRATALGNVRGRVDYISNPKRQEHIEAVHMTADKSFWRDLSAHCRSAARSAGKEKPCEGREFIVALANELSKYDPEELAKRISNLAKEMTGTENVVALHWNKAHNNYHCHIVVAENTLLQEKRQSAVLRQNTYFDADGKRSTKKKCLDAEGKLLPGCKMYPKGSCLKPEIKFSKKINFIASKPFLISLKQRMAEFQNVLLHEKRFRLSVQGCHMRQQHVGKGRPPAQEAAVRAKNASKSAFNKTVDKVLELEPRWLWIGPEGAWRVNNNRKVIKEVRNCEMLSDNRIDYKLGTLFKISQLRSHLESEEETLEEAAVEKVLRDALQYDGSIDISLPVDEIPQEQLGENARKILQDAVFLQDTYNEMVQCFGEDEWTLRECRKKIGEAAQEGLQQAFQVISQVNIEQHINHWGIVEYKDYLETMRSNGYFDFLEKSYRENLESAMETMDNIAQNNRRELWRMPKMGLDAMIEQGRKRAEAEQRRKQRQRQRDYDWEL